MVKLADCPACDRGDAHVEIAIVVVHVHKAKENACHTLTSNIYIYIISWLKCWEIL